jgi:hypothetical protein
LSDNYLNQAQNNAVVAQQEEMDRVGVEPTTSAMPRFAEAGKFNITVAVQS